MLVLRVPAIVSAHLHPHKFAPLLYTCAGLRAGISQPNSEASSLGQGLAALGQPFKLRLSRAPHERQLRDYGTNVVLIEPLATMSAVEDFLFPRVHRDAPSGASPNSPAPIAKAAEEEKDRVGALSKHDDATMDMQRSMHKCTSVLVHEPSFWGHCRYIIAVLAHLSSFMLH